MKSFESFTAVLLIIPKDVTRSHERATLSVPLVTDLTLPTGHIPRAVKSSKIQTKSPGFKSSESFVQLFNVTGLIQCNSSHKWLTIKGMENKPNLEKSFSKHLQLKIHFAGLNCQLCGLIDIKGKNDSSMA